MSRPTEQIDPRDAFIESNPTGLTAEELEKGRSGFVDHRTHSDYLIFHAGYAAGAEASQINKNPGHRDLVEAEGCKPEISIQPDSSPGAAGSVAHDLDKAEGEQPDLNIHASTSRPVSWLDPVSGRAAKSPSGRYRVPLCTFAELERLQQCLIAAVQGNEAMHNETLALHARLAERESLLDHWLQLANVCDDSLTDLMKETRALLDSERPCWERTARDVLAERRRQIFKGYTPDHDDHYSLGELTGYAAAHALIATGTAPGWVYQAGICSWQVKVEDPRTMLITSAALIMAEVDRIDRETQRGEIEAELVRLRQMTMDVNND